MDIPKLRKQALDVAGANPPYNVLHMTSSEMIDLLDVVQAAAGYVAACLDVAAVDRGDKEAWNDLRSALIRLDEA